jgi:hypothetical protein
LAELTYQKVFSFSTLLNNTSRTLNSGGVMNGLDS